MVPAPVGISAYIGDESNPGLVDATGSDARFNRIFSLTIDAAGNTYVIDQKPEFSPRNPVIRRITPEGVVTTLPKGSCYTDPRDLTVGNDGNLYILEWNQGAGRICRQTPAGEITLVFTQPPQPLQLQDQDLMYATIARGPGNDLFAASRRGVFRVTPGGSATFIAGSETFNPLGPGPFNPVDGTGAAARFANIAGITADAAGNVYVGEGFYGVRKVTPQGVVTTLALMPSLPGPVSLFGGFIDMHLGIAVQADGSVVVPQTAATVAGSALLRVAPDGQVSMLPGSENLVRSTPSLASDADGNITYSGVNAVGRLLRDGTRVALAGSGLPTEDLPAAVDAAGNLYTYGRLGAGRGVTLRKRNPQGQLVPYGPGRDTISLAPPDDNVVYAPVAITSNGTAYASYLRQRPTLPSPPDYYETEIYKIAPSGETTRILFARKGEANFAAPTAIAPAPDGTLYFIDVHHAALRKLNTDGSVVSVTPDGELLKGIGDGAAYRLGVSPAGKVYLFSEFQDRRVYTVNDAGRLALVAGQVREVPVVADGTGGGASFFFPTAPVFDEQGNLYVLDNNTLRRITPAGVVMTLAGVPGSQETRLGPLPGSLQPAQALARSPDGVFYVRSGDAIVRIRMPAP